MYKKVSIPRTNIVCNESVEGETIETKVLRISRNQEPIKDGAPTIYTDRKDGVLPEYDPRTDRWEVAVDAMDKVVKMNIAQREQRQKEKEDKNKPAPEKPAGGAEQRGQSGEPGVTGGTT